CFRYDRPWPYGDPWFVDYSGWIVACAVLFGAGLVVVWWSRRTGIAVLCAAALAFTVFGIDVYLVGAAKHWGMRALLERYYRDRRAFGVDLSYDGPGRLVADWDGRHELAVRSAIPVTLHAGDPMTVTWRLGDDAGALAGTVASVDAAGSELRIAVAADAK